MDGTRQVAQRMVNAEEHFAGVLMELAGCSKQDAYKAMNTLRKVRAIKVDPILGRMIVKHGRYMDPEVIRRAINA